MTATEVTPATQAGEPESLPTGEASLLYSRLPDLGDPQTCETPPAPTGLSLAHPLNLGSVAAIPLGEGRVFAVQGVQIAVFRLRNGGIYATQAICPHRNGPLIDGLIGGTTLVCPLHAWKWDMASGKALFGSCDLITYPVALNEAQEILLG